MKLIKLYFFALFHLSHLAINAQVSIMGASYNYLPTIPCQAFGAIWSCSPDSIDLVTRQYNLPGINGKKISDMDLMLASDGKMYGVTQEGNSIFSVDTLTGAYNLEFLFPEFIQNPCGTFVQTSNGKLYGITNQGGEHLRGVLYEYDINLKLCTKKFDLLDWPTGPLMLANDGNIYGVTSTGMYRYSPLTNAYYDSPFAFAGSSSAAGYLTQASNGKIYGQAKGSGFNPLGHLFCYDPVSNSTSIVYNFQMHTFFSFCNGMIEASNGKLYGIINNGSTANTIPFGGIFEFDPSTETCSIIHSFDPTDGYKPKGKLTEGYNGKLYGTTSTGSVSTNGNGGVFEFDFITGVYNYLANFGDIETGVAESGSRGSLTKISNNRFFAITYLTGIAMGGRLVEFNPSNNTISTKLHFNLAVNGANPTQGLTKTTTGLIYGTTTIGGETNKGTIFEYTPSSNSFIKKIDFADYPVNTPSNGLTEMPDGTFYGVAKYDSVDSFGNNYSNIWAIYQWNPTLDTLIIKKVFIDTLAQINPGASDLLLCDDGKLYGTGSRFSPSSTILFSFDPSANSFTVLYDYGTTNSSLIPAGNLLQASNGKIYGTVSNTGNTISGRLFEYDIPTGILTDKYFFDGTTLGKVPIGGLIEVTQGILYGLVRTGTLTGEFNGQIYSYDISNDTCTMVHQFTRSTDGLYPVGDLILASNGNLYGQTTHGKTSLNGSVFEYNLTTNTLRSILEMNKNNGLLAAGNLIEFSSPLSPLASNVDSTKILCKLSSTTISASVMSSNPLFYQWQYNDGNGWSYLSNSNIFSNVSTSILSIDSISLTLDSTYFRCIISSQWGSDTSGTTQLLVKPIIKPVITGPNVTCPGTTFILQDSINTNNNLNHAWLYYGAYLPGANDSTYLANNGGNYKLIVSNNYGCSDTSNAFNVLSGSPPLVAISNSNTTPTSCVSDSVILYSNYTCNQYQWLNNNAPILGAIDSTLEIIEGGQYTLIGYSAEGCSDTSSVINIQLECDTWPGDANNDTIVDNNDLLPIGLHFGETGLARATVSNLWQDWPSTDWGIAQTNNQDIKHADCNGDGVIDNNDTLAINLNFSLTHSIVPIENDERFVNPDIYIITSSNSYQPGDIVNAEIWLGTSTLPLTNLYGIAFNIDYDASLIQTGSENLSYPTSWMGTPGVDIIKLSKIDNVNSMAYGAETRITHNNVNGYGKIADFKFQLKNTIVSIDSLNLSVSYNNAIDSAGNIIPLNSVGTTIQVIPVNIHEIDNVSNLNIYPSPYTLNTQIDYSLTKNAFVILKIYNSIGQKIETLAHENQQAGQYSYSFSAKAKGYQPGVYFVKYTVNGVTTTKRIIELE